MNTARKPTCDQQRLDAFLTGQLTESESANLEQHLCECDACAGQLQLAAVAGSSWNEAAAMLSPDEYDGAVSLSSVTSAAPGFRSTRRSVPTAEMLTREIQGWLDPTDDPQMLGRFAGYEIVGIIGHGGMGIVLKGFESSLNRYVAVKILAPRLATNDAARKRFAREAQAAAAVLHDNVVAIHRVDEHHGLPFLTMPYNPGVSLQKRIDEEGRLPLEAVLRIGAQVAAGLAAAHQQGLVHRDIKPANILLERGVERVTITDFGLARAVDDASVTRTGLIAGTPQYMSPEQAQGKPLDARSDLFSLGSVMYAMAVGLPPFRGTASFEIIDRLTSRPAPTLRTANPDVPIWLETIVSRLHAVDPEQRFQSAAHVEQLLDECLAHLQQPNRNALPSELNSKRHSARTFLVGGVAVLAIAIYGVTVLGPDERTAGDSSTEKNSSAVVATPAGRRQQAVGLGEDSFSVVATSAAEEPTEAEQLDAALNGDQIELNRARTSAENLETRAEQFWKPLGVSGAFSEEKKK